MALDKPTVGQTAWGTVLNNSLDYLDTKLGPWVTAPSTASSTGVVGQVAKDTNYLYICVATNTWKRVGLSTWS
jgi:hypothetical protein